MKKRNPSRAHGTRAKARVVGFSPSQPSSAQSSAAQSSDAWPSILLSDAGLTSRSATGGPSGSPQVRRYRVDGWTPEVQDEFLRHFAETLNITRSCAAVNKTVRSYYELRKRDTVFDEACEDTLTQSYAVLEAALLDRAVNGTERQVIDRENNIVTLKEMDSRLGIRLLQLREQRATRRAAEDAKRRTAEAAPAPAAAPQEPDMSKEEEDRIMADISARLQELYEERKSWEARVIRAEEIAGIKPEESALPFAEGGGTRADEPNV